MAISRHIPAMFACLPLGIEQGSTFNDTAMNSKNKILVAFATAWGPKFGGINSFNADLMPAIAKEYGNEITTVCVVLSAGSTEIEEAKVVGVKLVSLNIPDVKEFIAGFEPQVSTALANDEINVQDKEVQIVWLGHDRITGAIALALARKHGGRSALIHHMSYADYEAFAENSDMAITKVAEQKELFNKADIVFAVGPLLRDALCVMLKRDKATMLVPGLPLIQLQTAPKTFTAFLSGRINRNSRKIKQAHLGVAAFAQAIKKCTEDRGFPSALQLSSGPKLTLRGVEFEESNKEGAEKGEFLLNQFAETHAGGVFALHALPFTDDREVLFNELSAASVAMMPSWHEGFGLVAWEAIAAGVPLILSSSSGAYLLLSEYREGILMSGVQVIDVHASHDDPYFNSGDKDRLVSALIQVAKEPAVHRARAVQLRNELLGQYTWPNCAASVINALGWKSDTNLNVVVNESGADGKILQSSGENSELPRDISMDAVRTSLASTSHIGRSWQREIAKTKLERPIVLELLKAIDAGESSILLTGLPGSGKTCAMLEVQDKLEKRAKDRKDLIPLFIQASEFADVATAQDRHARGLPEKWVEKVELLAYEARVVVLIDSLDVLSIAREHSVLTYFLAQIDRLLLIPQVTVITTCRSFDRSYDRSIAVRDWGLELTCPALGWDDEVAPLLAQLDIDTSSIDSVTRALICNPRELAIYVELVKNSGTVNAVTSQALTQQYLKITVQEDISLGDLAMESIEKMAQEMLKKRSLSIPRQRYTGTDMVLLALLSKRVLHKVEGDRLTFGHQTLLDVLVVSGALRQGITLHQFIQELPQVPFVRPSIRSFVAQLAAGDRAEFRKQLRTVLTGSDYAFPLRRLVAESLAEQKPLDEDWPLIRDLRAKHADVFQVIYTEATLFEWHPFWLKFLVPVLMEKRDADGLVRHVQHVSRWKNFDVSGILAFWTQAINLDWLDANRIARNLEVSLSEIKIEDFSLVAPLLEKLLSLPRLQHSFLGVGIARYVSAGFIDVSMLWRYVAGSITDVDALAIEFDEKLRCRPHDFSHNSNSTFFPDLMKQSTELLDLAIHSIEQWSEFRVAKQGNWMAGRIGFLSNTSFQEAHKEYEFHHRTSERALFDAIEAAILQQAKECSTWWLANRERLCLAKESALRYFAILACTAYPEDNQCQIFDMLCNQKLLESELSFELGNLLQAANWHLPTLNHECVQEIILTINENRLSSEEHLYQYVMFSRAELIKAVPCHMRIDSAQAVLDEYEKLFGTVIRVPIQFSRGGMVNAPFSFEVFLTTSDTGILQLLSHYAENERGGFDDMLIGGREEVAQELCEAASRAPVHFLNLLHTRWIDIPEHFRDYIMNGAANYLAYRYGNLQAAANWVPREESDASILVSAILDELERHPQQWERNRAASNALLSISYVIADIAAAERLVFLAIGFETLSENGVISGDNVDLIVEGMNLARGQVVEALMIVAIRFNEKGMLFPVLLEPALRRSAADGNPAIRAMILRHISNLQGYNPVLAWELFHIAIQDSDKLWRYAEPYLYRMYHDHFDKVEPILVRIVQEGSGKDLEVWGRISALAALTKQTNFLEFMETLKILDSIDSWGGAISVWTHPGNFQKYSQQCIAGLEAGLNARNAHAKIVAAKIEHLFNFDQFPPSIPVSIFKRCFEVMANSDSDMRHRLTRIEEWLNATAQIDPETALAVTELYLAFVKVEGSFIYDYDNNVPQLLTRLFAQAEEKEEVDLGAMLRRVVSLQDMLLELGLEGMKTWLKAAERP